MEKENRRDESTASDKKRISVLELPTVSGNIMKFLPARDVAKCSKVSTSWLTAANGVKNRRRSIYVISAPIIGEISTDDWLRPDAFLNVWSQPVVAIVFGYAFKIAHVLRLHRSLDMTSKKDRRRFPVMKKLFHKNLLKLESEIKNIRNYLPDDCSFLYINARTMTSCDSPSTLCSALILVPSAPGIHVQPFALPVAGETEFNTRRHIEKFFLFRKRNFSRNSVKCIILIEDVSNFNKIDVLDRNTYAETTFANDINEDTVIIEGCAETILSTGIAFSGENVDVEWLPFCDGCSVQCLLYFENCGLKGKSGLAFLLSSAWMTSDYSEVWILKKWTKLFPKIPITVISVTDLKYTEYNRVTPVSLYKDTNSGRTENSTMVIVLVTFNVKNITCKSAIM